MKAIRATNVMNPIIDWEDVDVWEYIRDRNIKYCTLYDEGHKRLGCIACPLQGGQGMKRDFKRWDKYKHNYIKAFDRMLLRLKAEGQERTEWKTGEDVMNWWINGAGR